MTDSQETARKIRQKNSRNVFAGFVSKRMRNDGGPASERRCRSRGRLVRGETRGRGGCAVDQSFSVVKRIAFFRLCSRSVLGRRESRHGAFHPETVKESLPCPPCRLSSSARSACSLPSVPGCTAPSDTIASIPSSCLERPRAASAARGLLRPSPERCRADDGEERPRALRFGDGGAAKPFARVAETPKRRRVGAQADAALGAGAHGTGAGRAGMVSVPSHGRRSHGAGFPGDRAATGTVFRRADRGVPLDFWP